MGVHFQKKNRTPFIFKRCSNVFDSLHRNQIGFFSFFATKQGYPKFFAHPLTGKTPATLSPKGGIGEGFGEHHQDAGKISAIFQ